jgi:hypothetical protein
MMPETPGNTRDGSAWRRVLGISHGLSGTMTTHSDPIQLLVRELNIVSATSLGRQALLRIEAAGYDTLGCTTVSELAHAIAWDPRKEVTPHPDLIAMVPLAVGDPEIALIVMVALRRPLRDIWFSNVRMGEYSDAGADVLAVLWSQFAGFREGENLDTIMDAVIMETRRNVRRIQRRSASHESIEGLDFVDEGPNSNELTDDVLSHLTDLGVVSRDNADLIHATRVAGIPLRDFVQSNDLDYWATWKRRRRAEEIVAGYLSRNAGLQ